MGAVSAQIALPFKAVETDGSNWAFAGKHKHQRDVTYEMALEEYLKDINKKHCAEPVIGTYGVRPIIESCPRAYYEWFIRPEYVRKKNYYQELLSWEKLDEGRVMHERLLSVTMPGTKEQFFDTTEHPIEATIEMVNNPSIVIRGIVDGLKGVLLDGFREPIYIPHEFKVARTLPQTRTPPRTARMQINFYMGVLGAPHGKLLYWGSPGARSRNRELVTYFVRFNESDYKTIINKAKNLHLALITGEPPRCECRESVAGVHEFI